MRIGMLVDVYKPHVSGITNYIALNKCYLENRGHEVFVFTFGDEDYQDDEPNIIRSPGLPLLDTGYYISFRYNLRARQLLHSMDIVHVHHPFLSGSLALRYSRPWGIPVIFTNHTRYDLYAQAYFPGIPEVVGETALQAYLPGFCRACTLVIAPSAGLKEVLLRFGIDAPIEVVPNGVDLEPFRSPAPLPRAQFSLNPSDVVFIYVGRLGPEKNLSFLLRAFNGVAQAYANLHLVVVGGGPERDNLEDLAQRMGLGAAVHFTGMVPYTEIPGYLALADAFVTASVTEVHPLSLIEAMAAGLPVLGIASPGVSDTIQDGRNGMLVPEQDLASFTARLVRLGIESELRRELGANARQEAQRYSIERTTQLMEVSYRRVLEMAEPRKHTLRVRLNRFLDTWR